MLSIPFATLPQELKVTHLESSPIMVFDSISFLCVYKWFDKDLPVFITIMFMKSNYLKKTDQNLPLAFEVLELFFVYNLNIDIGNLNVCEFKSILA